MIRTFIWGSCVSRDTFEFLGDGFSLEGYVARQSFLSAGNVVSGVDHEPIGTGFRNRIHLGDLSGDAFQRLTEAAPGTDLVLLDLCDERLGVVEVGGAYLTRSVERLQAGLQERLDSLGEVLEFGSYRHLMVWAAALERTTDLLRELDLLDRTIVLGIPWAEHDEQGEATPSSFGLRPGVANELFSLYHEAMEVCGLPVLGRELHPTAASDHQWGPAPFHYTDRCYRELAGLLQTRVAQG